MKRFLAPMFTVAALGLWLIAPASAAVEGDCTVDADCDKGFTCEVTGGSGCACPSEGECTPCETVEYRECVPGPCESDDDCADGMTCFSVEEPCPGVPVSTCAPGEECDPPEQPAPCEPTTRSACIPDWLLPCEADADCGAGFTCVVEEVCSCSGGGGTDVPPPTPAPDEPGSEAGGGDSGSDSGGSSGSSGSAGSGPDREDGAPRVPREEDFAPAECECGPGDTKYCKADEIECGDADDCPAQWTCEADDAPSVTTPACPPVPEGGSSDCEVPEAPAPPEPGPSMCYPPGYDFFGGYADGGGVGIDAPTRAEDGNVDEGSPEPSPTGPTSGSAQGEGAVSGSSGCTGGPAPAAPLAALMLLLAMTVLRRRSA